MLGQVLKARVTPARILDALRDPHYRTGYALVANTIGTTAVGFFYWVVAAHLYDRQALGRCSALVSALIVVSSLAQLDLPTILPRFLPRFQSGLVSGPEWNGAESQMFLPGRCRVAQRSMRNLIRTWARYSLISLFSMLQEVSSTSIDSMPRSVLAASARASRAACRQLSDETPTRSMVLTTATPNLLPT